MNKNNVILSQEQYNALQTHVTELGVRYIKTGFGWFSLRNAEDSAQMVPLVAVNMVPLIALNMVPGVALNMVPGLDALQER